jgi:hypothetical protein
MSGRDRSCGFGKVSGICLVGICFVGKVPVPALKNCFARFPILARDAFTAEHAEAAERISFFLFLLSLLCVLGDLGGEMFSGLL